MFSLKLVSFPWSPACISSFPGLKRRGVLLVNKLGVGAKDRGVLPADVASCHKRFPVESYMQILKNILKRGRGVLPADTLDIEQKHSGVLSFSVESCCIYRGV